MSTSGCPYCHGGEALAGFAIKIDDISEYSTLYLFKEQSHPGRVVVSFRGHVSELPDLDDDQRRGFMNDVARVGRMLHAEFKPAKVNYGAFGDKMPHLHFHLVPKYEDAFEWGGIFQMNPQQILLSEQAYDALASRIRVALAKV